MAVPAGFVTPDPAPAPQPAPQPAEAGDTAQDRINQLVKQSSAQDDQLKAAQSQNSALAQEITKLSQKVDALQGRPVDSAQDDPIAQLLSESTPASSKAKTLTPEETARLVSATVTKAIEPLVARAQAADEQSALAAAQNQSLMRAAQTNPKLADQNSEFSRAFAQVWDGLPDLQGLESGPELAAAITRGVLLDARAAETATETQKVAANITRPNTAGPTAAALKETNDASKAAELSQKLVDKGSIHGLNQQEELDMLNLAIRQQGG